MLNAVNTSAQTVAANQNILFQTTSYSSRRCTCQTGWLSHTEGSGLFTITNRKPYPMTIQVDFNANATSDTTGALAFTIELSGEAIGGTEMDYTVATADVYQNIGASTLLLIPAGSSSVISVGNISTVSALVKDANIIIKKFA